MTITRRIAQAAALIGVISGVALGFFSLSIEASARRAQFEENTTRFLNAIVPQLSAAYWEVDEARVESLLRGLLDDPLIVSVRINDPIMTDSLRKSSGLLVLAADRDTNPRAPLLFERLLRFSAAPTERRLGLTSPRDGSNLGQLEVRLRFDVVRDELSARSARVFGMSILQTLFVTVAVFLVMQLRVIRPLARLQAATSAVRDGGRFELPDRDQGFLDTRNRDEISRLARAFQRAFHEVERSRETLQNTVEELTRELVVARNRAEEASSAKSTFLANMNHELRTPLNAILGLSDRLLQSRPGAPERQQLGDLHKAAMMLAANINDVLDLSKIEAGVVDIASEDVAVNDLIDDLITQLRVLLAGRPIDLQWSFDPAVPQCVRVDRVRLRQILVNFASNAAKFTDKGAISFHTTSLPDHDALVFTVNDTGPGIPADQLDEIFRPFSQLDVSTTRSHGGTGLGLAIAKGLAAELDGEITVESQIGQGSTFQLTVPVTVLPDQRARPSWTVALVGEAEPLAHLEKMRHRLGFAIAPESQADVIPSRSDQIVAFRTASRDTSLLQPLLFSEFRDSVEMLLSATQDAVQPPLNGQTIAVVEDNPVNRRVISGILCDDGAEVLEFETGEAMVQAQAGFEPDMILMDLHMPGMDGRQTLAALRRASDGALPPVIAVTADATAQMRQTCLSLGFAAFLPKPVNPADLRATLDDLKGHDAPVCLDREAGLAYADGRAELYLDALRDFSGRIAGWKTALAGGAEARGQALHDLKGAAATLGAGALAKAAAGQDVPEVVMLMDQLSLEVVATLAIRPAEGPQSSR